MKRKLVRRPLHRDFRAPGRFPLRGAKQIADALGVTSRRLEQRLAAGDAALEKCDYPESIGYLTRRLLPKHGRRYLPVSRKKWEYILGSVLSQSEQPAQERDSRGQFGTETDFGRDQAHWIGTVHLVLTGEPGRYRIDKGRVEDLPNVRFGPFEIDALGDPVVETTYADLGLGGVL